MSSELTFDLAFPPAPTISPLAFERGLRKGIYILNRGRLYKRCPFCGDYWPVTWDYWQSGGRGKIKPKCKACLAEQSIERKRALLRAKAKWGYKSASDCKTR